METNITTSELTFQMGKFNITVVTTEKVKEGKKLIFRNNHCSVSTLAKMLKDKFNLEVQEYKEREDCYTITY